jgi:hypothetical protein
MITKGKEKKKNVMMISNQKKSMKKNLPSISFTFCIYRFLGKLLRNFINFFEKL